MNFQSELSLSQSVPFGNNLQSRTQLNLPAVTEILGLANRMTIHLSIPQNNYKMPLLQLNSVV